MATVEVAALHGLLLDLLATGDRARVDAAAHDLIDRVLAVSDVADGPPEG